MLALQEFRSRARSLPDLLQYAASVEDGIVKTKAGGLMASWYFRGRDTQSATNAELASISGRLNAALCMLGEGWMLHCDAVRRQANSYPEKGAFPDKTSLVIDEERRQQFLEEGAHYETFYALTLTFFPALTAKRRVADMMYEGVEKSSKDYVNDRIIQLFRKAVEDFESIFTGLFPARRMNVSRGYDEIGRPTAFCEQLQFYEYCVSGIDRPFRLPSVPMYLDAYLGTHEFVGGNEPRVGDNFICAVAIDGFAQESYPGIMQTLDDLAIEYRWSTRFIFHEPYKARALLERIRKKWLQKQRGLKDQVFNTSKGAVDLDAVNMTQDVEQAMSEAESSLVKFGNYTSVIILMNRDKRLLLEDARKVRKAVMNAGFGARIEEANAVQAYMGSLPGDHNANVRRPLLHTMNLADMLPITSIWAGEEHVSCQYFPPNSPALAYAATTGSTPFRVNNYVGDVGHSLLLGKTRGGKSTALAFLMAQWLRYENSQVFAFDKGYSMYVLCKAVGGQHYDLGGSRSNLSFAPLAEIDTAVDRATAVDWVRGCMEIQGLRIDSERINHINECINLLSQSSDRSLTKFQSLLSDSEMRSAMTPYTLKGPMGHLLDGQKNNVTFSRFVVFELDSLMKMGERNYAPLLLYIFNTIDKGLKGQPTFVPVDEAWLAFKIGIFREKLDEWARTWGKKVASLLLATQNMDDALKSELAPVLLQNFPCKIFLPNPEAQKNTFTPIYEAFGMNEREIQIIANATERRQYYYTSPVGRRLFSFGFGGVALSFIGAGGPQDIERCDEFIAQYGDEWPEHWLRARGLPEWADYWHTVEV